MHMRVCMCACGGVLNIKYKCHVAYVISVHKLTKCAAEDCRHSVIALTQTKTKTGIDQGVVSQSAVCGPG